MKKHFYILFGFVLTYSFGQQDYQTTQFFVNPYTYNPGYAGTENFIDAKIGGRYQWVGIEGAPETNYLSFHTTIGREYTPYHHKGQHDYWHGVGFYVYGDKSGPLFKRLLNASYAFNMPLTKKLRWSTGVFLGYKVFGIDGNYWNFIDKDDVAVNDQIDNDLTAGELSESVPDLSFGTWLYGEEYYLGISATQLLKNKLLEKNSEYEGGTGNTFLKRHLYITAGVKLPTSEISDIIPSFIVRYTSGAIPSIDINIRYNYSDIVYAGLTYRFMNTVAAVVGVLIKNRIEVNYSYDFTHTDLGVYNSGSHEVTIGLRIKYPQSVKNPNGYWKR